MRLVLGLDEHDRVAGLDVRGGHGHAKDPAIRDALVQIAPGDDGADQLRQGSGIEQAARTAVARRPEDPAHQAAQIAPTEAEDVLEAELAPTLGELPDGEVRQIVVGGHGAGIDRAHAGARKDPRPGRIAQPRYELPQDVPEDADFVSAARAASGENERERRVDVRHEINLTTDRR